MGRSRGVFAALVAAALAALAGATSGSARVDATTGAVRVAGVPVPVHVGRALASASAAHVDRTALSQELGVALVAPGLKRADEGALAVDLRTGAVVYALHPTRAFHPASNEKLTVAYTALVRLGAGYRFRTDVLGTGSHVRHTWRGNLYLQGHGDPTLTTRGLISLAKQLRRGGIQRVTGRVLADESAFDRRRTAPGWKPSFYMDESPPLSALVVNRAQRRGRTTPDPAGAAAALFTEVLKEHGVHVEHGSAWGTAPADATSLARVRSAPLADVLAFMDHESDNFTAEMVLKTLGAELADRGTTGAGVHVVLQTLQEAGVPLAGVRLADGSGLSRLDRLTPRALAGILTAAWGDPSLRRHLWTSLPLAGHNGTLEDRMLSRPAYGAVRAKTGTTDLASALSGYARRRYAFAILQNGDPISISSARRAQDRFATLLAARG